MDQTQNTLSLFVNTINGKFGNGSKRKQANKVQHI